jgi:hypothetical protein
MRQRNTRAQVAVQDNTFLIAFATTSLVTLAVVFSALAG